MPERFEPIKNPITPDYLAAQIALPQEQWSDEFRAYVEEKAKEEHGAAEYDAEPSPEERRRATFERYLKGLALSEDDLRGKTVIDLGSAEGGIRGGVRGSRCHRRGVRH